MNNSRGSFSNKIGFVLAAAGSAVGLGNLWRFPYLAAKYGGGIFLLVYLILAVSFGFALMVTEIAIGRKTGLSVVGAYKKLDQRFSFLGWLSCAVPFIITPYYCVIGGWVMKYLFTFLTGGMAAAAGDSFFSAHISQTASPLFWFALYLLLNTVVVIAGVEKGIEKASKFLMPVLILLSVGIAVFCISQPGAAAGLKYYLLPDFSQFSFKTVLGAMGQLFYSMSLAMGIMVTYGSYLKKEDNIEQSVRQIEIFDTLIAFLAGLMIIPSVFVFSGGNEDALNKGAGLMFITLPKVFDSMGAGAVIGCVFFLLVLFAALTSSISLMETNVSILCDKFGWERKRSSLIVAGYLLLTGAFVSMGYGVLDFIKVGSMQLLDLFDFVSNSVLMPLVAAITCIFIGHIKKTKVIEDEVELNGPFKAKKFYRFMIKYIAPVCLIAILIFSVMEALGFISI